MGDEAGGAVKGHPFQSRMSRLLLVAGALIIGYGIAGVFIDGARTRPAEWIKWFLGSLVAHDLVLAPLVFAAGVVVARAVPESWRAPVQAGLIISGIVTLSVYPFVRGYGRNPDNPSVLPNDYAEGLAIVLASLWIVILVVSLLRRRWPSRRER
jgi:hypothetical protein